jgi:hypothetical protein
MARQSTVPKPLFALVGVALFILLVASAITGQWAILVLGAVAVGALTVPFRKHPDL